MEPKYLTYDEYVAKGGQLSSGPFCLLEKRAEYKIDQVTFNRLHGIETIPEAVKLCVFELLEVLSKSDDIVASESVGSHSISYMGKKDRDQGTIDIIKTYLANTEINGVKVLYRGIDA